MPAKPKTAELSTEEKIKQAAATLFHKKGFKAVTSRDICEKAGINLALLNYYFRSKERLFGIIMHETLQQFIEVLRSILNEDSTLDEKVSHITSNYIDMLTRYPDLPFFVLNEVRTNPKAIPGRIREGFGKSVFVQQLKEKMKQEKQSIHELHLLANLISLIIFPVIGAPMFKAVSNMNDVAFNRFLQERKTMIPVWVRMMLETDINTGSIAVKKKKKP